MNAIPRLLGSFLLIASLPQLASAQRVEVQLWSDLPEDSFVVSRGQEINLSVKATEDSYVTVQGIDENGTVRVLFPNELQRDNFIYGGEEVPIASLRAHRTGPVYIEAIAVLSEDYDFRYGEVTPFWNAAWGEFYADNFISDDEREFPLELGRGDESAGDLQGDRLSEMIDADYASFEPMVRDFRDQTYEAVSREDWARSYVDVYVADDRSYEPRDSYDRPRYTYASYYDYDEPQFDYEVALTGHGTWFDFRGVRSWRPPTMFVEWRPFTNGYWTESSYGMHWVGYEPWAWVTYHYGSWWYEPGQGWIWIPDYRDYRWTPANCYWQTHGDYFMWYPAPPPRHVAMQINIDVDIDIHLDMRRAVVVHRNNFLNADLSKVLEPAERIHNVLRDVRPKFLPEPPGARLIEKMIGKAMPRVELQETRKPAMEGRAQVVIRKPTQMKETPKVFKELDTKVKKDVLAGKVKVKPAPVSGPGASEVKPGKPMGKPRVAMPKDRASSGPADKAKPVTPPPGAKVGEGKPRPPMPSPTVRPGKPASTAPRAEKQAPPRGSKPKPSVETKPKPSGQVPPAEERPRPGKPPKGEEQATPPAEKPRPTPPAEERPRPGKPPKGEEQATPPAGKPRPSPPAEAKPRPGKPPKGEERATPPAEAKPRPGKPPKGEEKATPPAEAKPKPGEAKPPAGKEREKAKAKPAEGETKEPKKGKKGDKEMTEEEKKKAEEEEAKKSGEKPKR